MDTSGKRNPYKKIFIITISILVLISSISFTVYHVNDKLQTNSDKIQQLQLELNSTNSNLSSLKQTTRLEINTLYNQVDNLEQSTQAEQIQQIQLQINTIEKQIENLNQAEQRLLSRIDNINEEKEKLKEIVGELYRYNQVLDQQLPEEDRSRAQEISSTIGDIIKGFIF